MDRNDVVTIFGIGCLAGGLWWIYPPAALIVVGLAMIGIGLLGAWKKVNLTPGPFPGREGEKDKGKR